MEFFSVIYWKNIVFLFYHRSTTHNLKLINITWRRQLNQFLYKKYVPSNSHWAKRGRHSTLGGQRLDVIFLLGIISAWSFCLVDISKVQLTPRNPRWPPKWLQILFWSLTFGTLPHRIMILVSRMGFSRARNPFLKFKYPRWRPKSKMAAKMAENHDFDHNFRTVPHRIMILVSRMGFSRSRNQFLKFKNSRW